MMKIAVIAPIEETIPPQKYGGIEWIVYQIAHGLGKKGHEVDLLASGDSKKDDAYTLLPITDRALRAQSMYFEHLDLREQAKLDSIERTITLLNEKKYDIVHNNTGWRLLQAAERIHSPVVTTHHNPLNIPHDDFVFLQTKKLPHISISNNQRLNLPELNFVATIYNGTNLSDFPFVESGAFDYMIFLARMSEEKGAIDAAKTAIATKKRLLAHSKVDKVNEEYFAEFNNVVDGNYVKYEGEIGMDEKATDLGNARCLLVPIKWEEPFGLMFTEAMACGTPVITYARGSAPEIIVDGETGFLVNQSEKLNRGNWIIKKTGIEGLCEAVERIYALPPQEYATMRHASRKRVEEHFTVERMVDEYEQAFLKLLRSKV